jgi:hypothetical protein
VLLFLAAITFAFWYLRNEEVSRAEESLRRDTEVAQQEIRLHLVDNQEQLLRIAREVATRAITPEQFVTQAAGFLQARPAVRYLNWLNAKGELRATQSLQSGAGLEEAAHGGNAVGSETPASVPQASEAALEAARAMRQPTYSAPSATPTASGPSNCRSPSSTGAFAGVLVAEYGLDTCCARRCRPR